LKVKGLLLLRPNDIVGLITMAEAVEAVEDGFREWGLNQTLNSPRSRIHAPSGVRVSVHPGGVPKLGAIGVMTHCELVQVVAESQKYSAFSEPVTVLYHSETTDLSAIIIGHIACRELPSTRQALRTAATSMVGTSHLARKDATAIGIFGTGIQARNHLVGICAIRKVSDVKVYSREQNHRKVFCDEMSGVVKANIQPVNKPEEAVKGMDVILTATNSNIPVFKGEWLQPGVHITSIVGSNIGLVRAGFAREKRRELDDMTVQRSDVIVVSSREQVVQDEQGDLFDPVQKGLIQWSQIGELSELLTGKIAGRSNSEQITLFKNNAGQGVADVALAARIYKKAKAAGLGIEIRNHSEDHGRGT
jgi:alanine dehydrogenase